MPELSPQMVRSEIARSLRATRDEAVLLELERRTADDSLWSALFRAELDQMLANSMYGWLLVAPEGSVSRVARVCAPVEKSPAQGPENLRWEIEDSLRVTHPGRALELASAICILQDGWREELAEARIDAEHGGRGWLRVDRGIRVKRARPEGIHVTGESPECRSCQWWSQKNRREATPHAN